MNRTLERRLTNVQRAIAERRWLNTSYIRLGEDQPVSRRIRPSHIYRSRDGAIVVEAYCGLRRDMRTFRLDQFQRLTLGDEAGPLDIPEGQVLVYPASWPLVQARPQTISQRALDRFLGSGWATQPFAGVIEPPLEQ